jgi:hypothetical protein
MSERLYPTILKVPVVVRATAFALQDPEGNGGIGIQENIHSSEMTWSNQEQMRDESRTASKIYHPKPIVAAPVSVSEDNFSEEDLDIREGGTEEEEEGDIEEDASECSDASSDEADRGMGTSDLNIQSPGLVAPIALPAAPAELTIENNSDEDLNYTIVRADSTSEEDDETRHGPDDPLAYKEVDEVSVIADYGHPPGSVTEDQSYPEDESGLADDEMSSNTDLGSMSCRSTLHHPIAGPPGFIHNLHSLQDAKSMSVADEDEISVYIEDNHSSPPSVEENPIVCPIACPPGRVTQLVDLEEESVFSKEASDGGSVDEDHSVDQKETKQPNLICPIAGPPGQDHFTENCANVTDEVEVNVSDETETEAAAGSESDGDVQSNSTINDHVGTKPDLPPIPDHISQARHELPPNLVHPKAGPPGSAPNLQFSHNVATDNESMVDEAEESCTPVIELPPDKDDEYYDVPTPTQDEPPTPTSCDLPVRDTYLSPVSVYKSHLSSAGEYSQSSQPSSVEYENIDHPFESDDTSKGCLTSQESSDCLTYEVKRTESGIVVMPRVDQITSSEDHLDAEQITDVQYEDTESSRRNRIASSSSTSSSVQIIGERHGNGSGDNTSETSSEDISEEEEEEEEEEDEELIRQEEKRKHDAWVAANNEQQNINLASDLNKSGAAQPACDESDQTIINERNSPKIDVVEGVGNNAKSPSLQTNSPKGTTCRSETSEVQEENDYIRSRLVSQGFIVENIVEIEPPIPSRPVLGEQKMLMSDEDNGCVLEVVHSETQEFDVSSILSKEIQSESDTAIEDEQEADQSIDNASSPVQDQAQDTIEYGGNTTIDEDQSPSPVEEVEVVNFQEELSLTLGQEFPENQSDLQLGDYEPPTPSLGIAEVEVEYSQDQPSQSLELGLPGDQEYHESPSDESEEDEPIAPALEIAEVEVRDSGSPPFLLAGQIPHGSRVQSDTKADVGEPPTPVIEVDVQDSKSPLNRLSPTLGEEVFDNQQDAESDVPSDESAPPTPRPGITENEVNNSQNYPSLTLGQEVRESQSGAESEKDDSSLMLSPSPSPAGGDDDNKMRCSEADDEEEVQSPPSLKPVDIEISQAEGLASDADLSDAESVASLTLGQRALGSPQDEDQHSSEDTSEDEEVDSLTPGQGHLHHYREGSVSPVMPVLEFRPPSPPDDRADCCNSEDMSPEISNLNKSYGGQSPRSPEVPVLDPDVCLDDYDVISLPFNPGHQFSTTDEDRDTPDEEGVTNLTRSPELPNYHYSDKECSDTNVGRPSGDRSPVIPFMDEHIDIGHSEEALDDAHTQKLKTQGLECNSALTCAGKTADDPLNHSERFENIGMVCLEGSSVPNVKVKAQEVRQCQVSKEDYRSQNRIYAACGMMDSDSQSGSESIPLDLSVKVGRVSNSSTVADSAKRSGPLQKSEVSESKSFYDSQLSRFSSIHSMRHHTLDSRCEEILNRTSPERPTSRRNSATRASPTAAELLSARMEVDDEDSDINSDEEIDVVGIDDDDVFLGGQMENEPADMMPPALVEKQTINEPVDQVTHEQQQENTDFTRIPERLDSPQLEVVEFDLSETDNQQMEEVADQPQTRTPERPNTPEPESDMVDTAVFPNKTNQGQYEQTTDITRTPERSRSNTPDSGTHSFPSPTIDDENLRNMENDPEEYEVQLIKIMTPVTPPPSRKHVIADMKDLVYSGSRYKEPFYSNKSDVPANIMDVGGRLLKVKATSVSSLLFYFLLKNVKREML